MANETFTVERSATMAAPPGRVYDQVANFHNWLAWSPWEARDPQQTRTYSGPDSGTGASYAWAGNRKVGEGRMHIVDASEPDRVAIDLQFIKPFKSRNETVFRIEPDGTGSRVTWTMTGPKTFLTKVMGIFKSMDAAIGPDFEKGLAKLKTTVEHASG